MMKIVIGILVAFISNAIFNVNADVPDVLNECVRGVKRRHTSNAGMFQVFSMQSSRGEWLNVRCPQQEVFDVQECACLASWRQRTYSYEGDTAGQSNWVNRGQGQREDGVISRGEPSQWYGRKQQTTPRWAQPTPVTPRRTQTRVIDCTLHQPAHNLGHFNIWQHGQWAEQDCNYPVDAGLVWSQAHCRCMWGPQGDYAAAANVDAGFTQGLKVVNGTNGIYWDSARTDHNTVSRINTKHLPNECVTMLNITFDQGQIRDEERNIWLNVRSRQNNPQQPLAQRDASAIGGYSARFREASLVMPYFKSNALGHVFHIGFRFKMCPGNPNVEIPLLHNNCSENHSGPSIKISYVPWTNQIQISMTTDASRAATETCVLRQPLTSWRQMDFLYGDNFLEVKVDGVLCVESDKFVGALPATNCPMTLLGEAFCGSLDHVEITKGCE